MTSNVTKDQWRQIEAELSKSHGNVVLRCDGYEVKAAIEAVSLLRQGVVIYVNGWIKGEWMNGEAEEAKKFYRPMKRYLYSAKQREEAKKKAKSRKLDESVRQIYAHMGEAHVTTWAPYWTNAKEFCRCIRKTCSDIAVVKIGYRGEA